MESQGNSKIIDSQSIQIFAIKSLSPEPEVEECCEDIQLREIVQELGIDFQSLSSQKFISHDSNSETCIHCKLLSKLMCLQEEISTVTQSIKENQEILKIRKFQNNELKEIIESLETNTRCKIAKENSIENIEKSCSCNKCFII